MKKICTLILAAIAIGNAGAKTVYVDATGGDDSWTGKTEAARDGDGPVRSFARATTLLEPGDTLSLARDGGPYRESLVLNRSGTEENPIVVEGNGAVIDLSQDLTNAAWRKDGAGWICDSLRAPAEMKKQLTFAFVQGIPVVMKESSDAGQFIVERTDAGLLRVVLPAGFQPPFRSFLGMGDESGVRFQAVSHVVVKNLRVRGAGDDGFSFHGPCRNLVIEDCSAVLCGDEGASAHGPGEGTFRRCLFAWNGSRQGGVVDVQNSSTRYEQCLSAFNRGTGYNLVGKRHELEGCFSIGNTQLETPADLPPAKVQVTGFVEIPASEAKAAIEKMTGVNPLAAILAAVASEIGWNEKP